MTQGLVSSSAKRFTLSFSAQFFLKHASNSGLSWNRYPVQELDVVPLGFGIAMCQEDGEDGGAEPHFITKIAFPLCVVMVTSAFGNVSQSPCWNHLSGWSFILCLSLSPHTLNLSAKAPLSTLLNTTFLSSPVRYRAAPIPSQLLLRLTAVTPVLPVSAA